MWQRRRWKVQCGNYRGAGEAESSSRFGARNAVWRQPARPMEFDSASFGFWPRYSVLNEFGERGTASFVERPLKLQSIGTA